MRTLLAALVLALAACAPAEPPPVEVEAPCAITLVALPPDVTIDEDDPLPDGSRIIAAPQDFDIGSTTIEDDATGNEVVTLRLRGAAVERLAAHTADHIGDQIAILVDGDVVSVPMIQAHIVGGEISITRGSLDPDGLVQRLTACSQ